MHIPDNEGKACDAIVRLLEKWTGETRVGIRHPEKDCMQDTPTGFNCAIELLRWPDAAPIRRKPGSLGMRLYCPNDFSDLEDRRIDRLRRAFSKKSPKLQKCKKEGGRTVLVLESGDIALTRFDLIGNLLPKLLAECTDAPDEIYLVETGIDLWWVYLMKRDGDYWPTVGMPKWGQPIYDPDKSPTAGMPKEYRDALQLDELYTPHLRGWTPATFEEDELDDLTLGRGSKRS